MSAARRPPRLLLVTGMSGAGKSNVLDALEDMGWDTVDNLPADLLQAFVDGGAECRVVPAAVAMDVRSRGFDPSKLPELIRSIKGVSPEILYLDCAGSELMRRYDKHAASIRLRPTVRRRTESPASAGSPHRSAPSPTASSTPPICRRRSCATSFGDAMAAIPDSRC